ncbi:MAG: DUF4231 domain-containing protein [Gammaproteobacteria bacterium]|nr:DUF4231 domain-containing protein [Gammaproteobacteria bacterium]
MADDLLVEENSFPGLYQSADKASIEAQKIYFGGLFFYLGLLVLAALVSFAWPKFVAGAIVSVMLFLATLGILIFLRVNRPDDVWYNGRAVAESVKTISWRWMMRADPYPDCADVAIVRRQLIDDLKDILDQNKGLSHSLNSSAASNDPISETMSQIRNYPISQRLEIYKRQRIEDQAGWYTKKSAYNRRRAKFWFWVSVILHLVAITLLLYKIYSPTSDLPIEVIATAAGAVLTNSEKNYPTLIQNISDMLFIEKPFNYLRILLQ